MIAHCSRLIFIQSWNARKGRNQWSLGYYLIGKPRRFTIASARNRIAKASMRMSRERLSSGMGSSIGQTAFWNSVVARADSRRDFLKNTFLRMQAILGSISARQWLLWPRSDLLVSDLEQNCISPTVHHGSISRAVHLIDSYQTTFLIY